MDTLMEWGILALGIAVGYSIFKLLTNHFKRVADQNTAYKKAVEKINKLNREQDDARLLERFNRDNTRVKVIDKASRSGGDFQSNKFSVRNGYGEATVPSQLVDSNFNLYGLDISSDNSQDVSGISHYDGAGHGGSFGGGGASGSWGSDDNSSSSYSDSGSSDSGGSDSSSSD